MTRSDLIDRAILKQHQTLKELDNIYNRQIKELMDQKAKIRDRVNDLFRREIKNINEYYDNQHEHQLESGKQNEILFSGIPSDNSNASLSKAVNVSLNDKKRNENESMSNRKRKSIANHGQPKQKKRRTSSTNTKKKFKCHICNKLYASKGILATHNRIHTGERPYQCHICTKSFPQQAELSQHVKNSHTANANSDKKYQCRICWKRYKHESSLMAHKCKKGKGKGNGG